MKIKLDKYEKEILDSVENGEWKTVKNFESEKKRLQQIARESIKKNKRINIRLTERDLNGLKTKAVRDGIPYQTLIASVLHKFVAGRLVEA